MLTIPTPTTVHPVPADALDRGRTPGAVGLLLDPEVIEAYVREHVLGRFEDDTRKVRAEHMLLLRSPIGELAIIGTEGVGDAVDEALGTVPAYVAIGWQYELVSLPHEVIQSAITGEGADVAGFVRRFGDRLDTNAYIWRRFCGVA